MAKCDQGYLCVVCGQEVKRIDQSELYLRYVLGLIDSKKLNQLPERHLQCSPGIAQFIQAPPFEDMEAEGVAGKSQLDPDFCQEQEKKYTEGYERLVYLQKHRRNLTIDQYPI